MEAKGVYVKGALPWVVRWARCAGKSDFCPALADLVGAVQNIFSAQEIISLYLSSLPSKLGRQSCRVACLLICVSG
jgi:hypothetical protein